MDNIDAVVDELGVRDLGDYDGSVFLIELDSSDQFANVYTTISDKFELEKEAQNEFDDMKSTAIFSNDSIEIITSADYENDRYAITIGEK